MAKKKTGVNRSQAIRELLEKNPKLTAKEISDQLAQKQITASSKLIYMIKGRMAQVTSTKKKKAARVATASQTTGSSDPVALILQVKELAKAAGGMSNLKTLISALSH